MQVYARFVGERIQVEFNGQLQGFEMLSFIAEVFKNNHLLNLTKKNPNLNENNSQSSSLNPHPTFQRNKFK